jgi:hypothetical protein
MPAAENRSFFDSLKIRWKCTFFANGFFMESVCFSKACRMNYCLRFFAACSLLLVSHFLFAQDSAVYNWNVSSRKLAEGRYEIPLFYTRRKRLAVVCTQSNPERSSHGNPFNFPIPQSASGAFEDSGSVKTVKSAFLKVQR